MGIKLQDINRPSRSEHAPINRRLLLMPTTDYSEWSREQLIELISQLQGGAQGEQACEDRLAHALQTHQAELGMQNQALRDTREQMERDRYADLYNFASVGYLTLDEHGRILEANLTAAALFGRERANIVGKPFVSLLAPGEVETFFSHLREVFQSRDNLATELSIQANGEIHYVQLESAAYWKPEETTRYCRTMMIDITEQKVMAGSLAQFRSRQKALLDMIPAAVYFKDRNLRYFSMNQFCSELMQLPIAEMIGKTPFDLFPREMAEALHNSDLAILQSGGAMMDMEQQIVDARGNTILLSISKAPYYGQDGEIAGIVAVGVNITPIREAERRSHELVQENRRLTRRLFSVQENERRHLARELHDELGQWLTAIQADAQSINCAATICKERKSDCLEGSQSILDSTSQVNQIVRRILRRLRPSLLDQIGLADSLREMIGTWRMHHPETKCDLVLHGPFEDLSEIANITLYRTVQEALTNISSHADASRVSIGLRCEPDCIRLSVDDNGKGIDKLRRGRGLGILAMRERIIAAGGKLKVHSKPDQGTQIKVTLPLNLQEENHEDTKPEDRETD